MDRSFFISQTSRLFLKLLKKLIKYIEKLMKNFLQSVIFIFYEGYYKGSSAILSNKFEVSRILFYKNTNRFFVTGETSPTLSISPVSWFYTAELSQREICIFRII